MTKFIAINDSLEICYINKTKAEISELSPDYFLGRVWSNLWQGIASLCGLFLCVIAANFITC